MFHILVARACFAEASLKHCVFTLRTPHVIGFLTDRLGAETDDRDRVEPEDSRILTTPKEFGTVCLGIPFHAAGWIELRYSAGLDG